MTLLYLSGQGDIWLTKGETFAKENINNFKGNKAELSLIWNQYGILLDNRFDLTANKMDQLAALDAFGRAISLDPKNVFFYQKRGASYLFNCDWNRAVEDYKAIDLDPKNAAAYGSIVSDFMHQGDGNRAIEACTKAICLDPKDAAAYRNRGYVYSEKGDWDRAVEDYTNAIGLDPKDKDYQRSMVYGDRASAYLAKHDKKRWFTDFKRGMELGSAPQ